MTKRWARPRTERPAFRILGIDPGSQIAGWGLVAGTPTDPRIVECGQVVLGAKDPLPARLARLQAEFQVLIDRLEPTEAAVESPFHGASARSALQLAHARGVILAALGRRGLPVSEYTPASVKKSVTGNGRAGKGQVTAMVARLLGVERTDRRHDVYDALAVALCHLSTANYLAAVGRASER